MQEFISLWGRACLMNDMQALAVPHTKIEALPARVYIYNTQKGVNFLWPIIYFT